MTDAASWYTHMNKDGRFASHDRVYHTKKEYARYEDGRPVIHTNTVEDYVSVFKRGMRGTYQHCKEKHLHCYLADFDFRTTTDQHSASRTSNARSRRSQAQKERG